MKRVVLLGLVITGLLLSYPLFVMGGEVQIGVRVILASHKGRGVDVSLQDIQKTLSQMFNYSSYRLLQGHSLLLAQDQTSRLTLTEDKELLVRYLQEQGGAVEIAVEILQAKKGIFRTKVKLKKGGALLIGGPKHEEGVLILAIAAHGS